LAFFYLSNEFFVAQLHKLDISSDYSIKIAGNLRLLNDIVKVVIMWSYDFTLNSDELTWDF